MSRPFVIQRAVLLVLPLAGLACLVSLCQAQTGQLSRDRLEEPVLRVAKADTDKSAAEQPREHPLAPVVKMAHDGLVDFRKVPDYQATLVKRERVDGKLLEHEYMFVKIRHEQMEGDKIVTPFSAYLYFLAPDRIKGREVIWIKGQNEGKLIAHEGGRILGSVTAYLDPLGKMAMKDCRYPITEIGIKTLVERLIDVGERDMKYGECEVQYFEGAKINGRVCKCIQVVHPYPRKNFRFHKAQIFLDKELGLPIRFASWSWPAEPGGKPLLLEEYTYLNLKLDNGFTDVDFSPENPNYNFPAITMGKPGTDDEKIEE